MTQAIGSLTSSATNPGAATATLEAQLVRYQKQLSECVNCDSSNTAEGKAQIEDISTKIADIRGRIDKVAEIASGAKTSALGTNPSTSASIVAPASPASKSAISTTGSIVDVSA